MLENKKKTELTDEELLTEDLRFEEEVLIEADNDFESDDSEKEEE